MSEQQIKNQNKELEPNIQQEDDEPPPLIEGMFAGWNSENPDEMGNVIGKSFGNMFKQLKEVIGEPGRPNLDENERDPEVINNKMGGVFTKMFGAEIWEQAQREIRINLFFQDCLKTGTLNDAKRLTKAEFNLPDDYVIKLNFEIRLGETADVIVEDPSMD